MEKIDILLATYNGEKYLKEQLDSILGQTYSMFELLISDDGSTDNTVTILKEYEKKDDRITLFLHEKNTGYIPNFEFLLQQVSADIYMSADQDDIWLPQKIEKTYQKLVEENADLVHCDLELINETGAVIVSSRWKMFHMMKKIRYDDIRTEYLYNCVTGCTLMSRSKWIPQILPLPKTSAFMPHDYWIALVIALKGKLAHLEESLIQYRQHGNNLIGSERASFKMKRFEEVRNLFIRVKIEHFEEFLKRKEVFNETQNQWNEKCLTYFKHLKQVKYINFKGWNVFHRLYKDDTFSYYMVQGTILNFPCIARLGFHLFQLLKKLKKDVNITHE